MWKSKTTLAIETSCDDTSLGIIRYEDGFFYVDKICAYSQIDDHQQYGGVVPEIAFRLHSEQILALLKQFSVDELQAIDSFSVTTHPWLAWSLLVWKTVAHMLWHHYNKPVVWVHHIYGHIFSLLLERNVKNIQFPWVILTASGWHNEIYLIDKEEWTGSNNEKDSSLRSEWHVLNDCNSLSSEWQCKSVPLLFEWQYDYLPYSLADLRITKLWKTLDDAAGECFDKVARMLWGPYPWWQWIGEQAKIGSPHPDYRFKRIMMEGNDNPYDFSFSGMKAHTYTLLQHLEKAWVSLQWQVLSDIAYEFQEAITDTLTLKLQNAAMQYHVKTIWIVGWVSANDRLFEKANSLMSGAVLRPIKKLYSTDNAAMIGVVGLLS